MNRYKNPDNDSRGAWVSGDMTVKTYNSNYDFEITTPSGRKVSPPKGICWRFSKEKVAELILENRVWFGANGDNVPRLKRFLNEVKEGITPLTIWYHKDVAHNQEAAQELRKLFEGELYFETPKPIRLIKRIIHLASKENEIVLDFFAGSGTTGHAVMQLNAEDGGNRKFILCQIDEPIDKKKPAYKFCIDNKLPPVISSITIERLKRAGEKIAKEQEEKIKKKAGELDFSMVAEKQTSYYSKNTLDLGFKVFDNVEAPKLKVDETGQISITENETDALSRIYNMIFTIGLDEPIQVPEEVVKDSIYKIGNHFYITNSEKITSDDYSNAIKNGKVFIDGWTASLNGTLQNYKEDVKIVF